MKNKIYVRSSLKFLFYFIIIFIFSSALQAQTFPPGFSQVQISGIYYPTSMAFAPDGRIFVTEKAGHVRIVKNGIVLSTPFATVTVDQLNERGLSSVCLDPDFESNHYVYVYYTSTSGSIHNRLSRFTASGDVAIPGSEQILLEFEPLVNSIHNSGGMAFGLDGKLFLAVGNDNVNSNSQDLSNYKGKVLRINPDGSVPSGNPFTGSESAKRIWAYGLRNPWTIALQPGTGKLFIDDVGEATWEEINDGTVAGRNFGWPATEGATTNPAYTTPVYTYHHGTGSTDLGCAVTGGAFFNPATTNYPSMYTGKYFFIDYCGGWMNYLDMSSGTAVKQNFATGLAGAGNYCKVGTDGNLYYFSISQNSLYKIIYSSVNAPLITTQPSDVSVPQGQNATFSVTASGASPLSYQWRKGGTAITGANSASYTIVHAQNTDAGQYSCLVSNSFGSVTSHNALLTVTAPNARPTATILTPGSGTFYRDGDVINFSGNGTDPEDGTLPASAFNWFIQFHHDAHYHPGPFIPPGVKTGSFSTTFGETSANVYFRLFLVVNDSQGQTDTAFVDIHPVTSTLTITSQPSGLQFLLDGLPHTAPYSVLAVSGMHRTLNATTPQTLGDSNYVFNHWSQGGAASQTIVISDASQTFKAFYNSSGPATSCSATGQIAREYWAGVTGVNISDIPVNTTPTTTSMLTIFEGPSNVADHYGDRIRGYICPPVTGNYVFWIASDDNSELWLSTDSSVSAKVKIASVATYTGSREWTKFTSQQSVAIHLVAGNKYYIESLHHEGTMGDNIAVGWKLPDGTLERPIPGSRLSPYTAPSGSTPVVTITAPTGGTSYSNPSNITITANASSAGGTISKVEFFENGTLLGQDLTAPYSYTWMGATTGNYALTAKATNNTGQVGTSAAVNITVAGCPTPIITATGPTTLCSGSVVLKTNTAPGNLYQWKKDGANISGATASSYTATVTGDYQVKVINGSCVAWSAPTHVSIQSGLSASITPGGPTTFCTGGNVKLYANTCAGYSYQWKKDGANIAGATADVYTATVTGSYQLMITQSGANAWSALVSVQVNACAGLSEKDSTQEESNKSMTGIESVDSTGRFEIKVYPNPTSGLFTIVLNMSASKEEKIKARVVNLLGQEVYNREFVADNTTLNETVDLDSSLPTGIYTLQVIIGTKQESTSVVLSR
ncbi:MAG: PQQ-dependent sugar dehydrogenase [Bacteroidia bacterium]